MLSNPTLKPIKLVSVMLIFVGLTTSCENYHYCQLNDSVLTIHCMGQDFEVHSISDVNNVVSPLLEIAMNLSKSSVGDLLHHNQTNILIFNTTFQDFHIKNCCKSSNVSHIKSGEKYNVQDIIYSSDYLADTQLTGNFSIYVRNVHECTANFISPEKDIVINLAEKNFCLKLSEICDFKRKDLVSPAKDDMKHLIMLFPFFILTIFVGICMYLYFFQLKPLS